MELLGKQQCIVSQCFGGDVGTQRQPGQGFGCRVQSAGQLHAGLLFCFRGPSDADCVTRTAWWPCGGIRGGSPYAISVSFVETFSVLFPTPSVYGSLRCGLCAHLDLHLAWTKALLPCASSLPALGPHPVPSGRPDETENRKEITVPILRGSLECQS